jgi:hypothetical protein
MASRPFLNFLFLKKLISVHSGSLARYAHARG